jgi:hypothetical protein
MQITAILAGRTVPGFKDVLGHAARKGFCERCRKGIKTEAR